MLPRSLKILSRKNFLRYNYSVEVTNKEIDDCLKIKNPTDAAIKALNHFAKLKKNNERIEKSTIQSLINVFHETKFYEQIYETYEYIRTKDFELFDENTLSEKKKLKFFRCQLIVGCAQSNRFQEIEDILKKMKEENMEFNLKIYNCLLKCYTKKYDVVKSLKIYKEMKENNIHPDSDTLISLLETFLNKKDSRFQIIFDWFVQENIVINEDAIRTYFKCLCLLTKDIEYAFNFATRNNLWDEESYKLIFKACSIQNDKQKALSIYHKIVTDGEIKINVEIFNAFIETFSNDGDYIIFKLYDNFDGEANIDTFNLLLKPTCMKNDLEKAKEIYKEIREKDLQPNVVTQNMFMAPLFHQKWKPHIDKLMAHEK